MERIAELIEYLEEAMETAAQEWIEQLKKVDTTSIKKILQEVGENAHPDSHVVITYLRSSVITDSHQFRLAVYQGEPFVEVPIYHTLLDMKPLYQEVLNDVQVLIKKLSPPYFQILSSEKEEIRRSFTVKLYQQSYHFFERVLEEMSADHQQIIIYFGEEMSELMMIGAEE